MDKKFHRLYLHEIAFNLIAQQLFCKKPKISVKQKKHDFEMSMPSCSIMLHLNDSLRKSTNYKIMFLSLTIPPEILPFGSKSLL